MVASKDAVSLESVITEWLVELTKNGKLLLEIKNQEAIKKLAMLTEQEGFIPSFSIDYWSRYACAKAGDFVLKQLGHLELIDVNKSISLTSGEILRPDIVAFNPESRPLTVFEVKREILTGRRAITELLGYELSVNA